MPENNRLRYTGANAKVLHIAVSLSMTAAGNNKLVGLTIAKNDQPLVGVAITRQIGTGSDVGSTALHGACEVATNDYIELWVTNLTDTTSVTVQASNFFAMAMPVA